MILLARLLVILLPFATIGLGQDKTLKNEDIVKMVEAGFGSELIVTMVSSSPCEFATDVDSILVLKEKQVPEEVIRAMLLKSAGMQPKPDSQGSTPSSDDSAETRAGTIPPYLGVYFKRDGEWVEILPEVINWKTGGVLKSIATVGVVKGDVNGKIDGPHSRSRVFAPLDFIINTPEGVAITEYQFIRLREKKNRREFRTVTGGVFHASGGSTRDLVPFEGKRISSHTYSITLTTLNPGEYGFLPPGAFTSSHASASLGKMYTFTIVE